VTVENSSPVAKVITGVFDYISQSACVSSGHEQLSNISMVSVFVSHRVDTAIQTRTTSIHVCYGEKGRQMERETRRGRESDREGDRKINCPCLKIHSKRVISLGR